MEFEKEEDLSIMLGIGFKHMTLYKAELIHLKNDGLSAKKISEILNVPESTIYNWYNKQKQPKDEIIEKLEKMYFERECGMINKMRKPERKRK